MAAAAALSVIYVTVNSMALAESLAGHLVASRLAACVNIIPGVTSVYEWQGKLEKDQELLLMIKTRTEMIPDLVKEVRAKHPYDVPEVISVPMGQGHDDYLNWVRAQTTTTTAARSVEGVDNEKGL